MQLVARERSWSWVELGGRETGCFRNMGDTGRNGEIGDGASGSLEASVKPPSAGASPRTPD